MAGAASMAAMNMPLLVTFGDYLKARHGTKVRKLGLDAGFTCPNRDGSIGRGGCSFCNVAAFADEQAVQLSLSSQLQQRRAELRPGSHKFLAYFQAYSSSYGEYQQLQQLYRAALAEPDIVGLCVATRPDCVSDAALGLLAALRDEGREVWLELGLQSAHDRTLKRINRGHDFAAYAATVARLQRHGLNLCTHLIAGLPGEDETHCQQTLSRVLELGCDGLKLHPLHVVAGSRLALSWRAGRYQPWPLARYSALAADLIRHTPRSVLYHRISATARAPLLLAPAWVAERWAAHHAIHQLLQQQGGQGSGLSLPGRSLVSVVGDKHGAQGAQGAFNLAELGGADKNGVITGDGAKDPLCLAE